MRRFVPAIFILLVLLAPLPPLFTRGACTAEFEQASSAIEQLKSELHTLSAANAYLMAHQIPYGTVSPERCQRSPPRDVVVCPGGPILIIAVPVRNRVCLHYRDATIRQQSGYNDREQLVRPALSWNFEKLRLHSYGVPCAFSAVLTAIWRAALH